MISVIIPTYNRSREIREAMASLVNQTIERCEFEVIIVDDGSQDNTADVVAQFKNQLDIKYFKQNHGGASRARNLAIDNALDEVLVFFDDDAIADSKWLENIAQIMKSRDIITGRVKSLHNNIWQYFAPHYNQGDTPVKSEVFLEGNSAVKKEVFVAVGKFDDNLDYGHEGEEFIRRAKQKYDFWYYPEVIIYHDYATGVFNYFNKQRRFGEKMVYLHHDQIKSLTDLMKNYKKFKGVGRGKNFKTQKPGIRQAIVIKIIARLGNLCHYSGAIMGYYKYKS